MTIRSLRYIGLLLGLLIFAASCTSKSSTDEPTTPTNSNDNAHEPRLRVISSFGIVTNIAEEIGQEFVEVHNLVPVGTDPHDYAPRANDVKFMSDADLLLYNGLNLEGGSDGWLAKLADTTGKPDLLRVAAAEDVKPLYISDQKGQKEVNPHAFVSPKVGVLMAKRVRDALIEADPAHAETYETNAAKYLEDLEALEQKYEKTFADIPQERRVFIACEQAFQYLVKAYGLTGGYIWAIDTDKAGSPSQIKSAIAFVKEHKPPVLFVESNVDRRPMETVSDATNTPIYPTPIFSDELGKPGEPADTYLGYLAYNLEHISAGLRFEK